jgi:hypothetical protein
MTIPLLRPAGITMPGGHVETVPDAIFECVSKLHKTTAPAVFPLPTEVEYAALA